MSFYAVILVSYKYDIVLPAGCGTPRGVHWRAFGKVGCFLRVAAGTFNFRRREMHNVFGVTLFVSVASGVPFLLFCLKSTGGPSSSRNIFR